MCTICGKSRFFKNNDFLPLPIQRQDADLDPMQNVVVDAFKSFLQLRSQYYEEHFFLDIHSNSSADGINDWLKIISITGKPGTGKTKCLHCCIQHSINQKMLCCDTNRIPCFIIQYKALFYPDIDTNMIHSSFYIALDGSMPEINCSLAMYNVIIID